MDEPMIDAVLCTLPARCALAARDVAAVFRMLIDAGVSQRRIVELTSMGQSEVSEVLAAGRQGQAVSVLERMPRLGSAPWMDGG